MIVVAALWIAALLLIGGFALDRVLSRSIVDNFDNQLVMLSQRRCSPRPRSVPTARSASTALPPTSALSSPIPGLFPDQRRGRGALPVAVAVGSPAAGQRGPRRREAAPLRQRRILDARPAEPLRIAERDVILPGFEIRWRFQVAQSRETIDEQIHRFARRCSGALPRSASACLSWRRCRPFTGFGRYAEYARKLPRSGRARRPGSATTFRPRSGR